MPNKFLEKTLTPDKNKLSKIVKFYVNGTSHSHGGGLETPEEREDSVRPIYHQLFPALVDTTTDRHHLNYAAHLSTILNIPFDNESECGGGMQRMVRMTYEWIYHHWQHRENIFIILENPDYSRMEAYYKPRNSYYIINTNPILKRFEKATRRYWDSNVREADEELHTYWNLYYNTHIDIVEEIKKNQSALIGLYSFCKQQGINCFIMNDFIMPPWQDVIDPKDIITFQLPNGQRITGDIYEYCLEKKLTISHELGGRAEDEHPGIFGHQLYAKELAKWIEKRLNDCSKT